MKNHALNLRRLLAHVALGMLLLFSQQHAVQHWLSHAVEATKNQSAPAAQHCEACDGLAAFGAALPVPPAAFTVLDGFEHVQPVIRLTQPVLAAAPVAYLSRAPPTLG